MYDFRKDPKAESKKNPLFKIQLLLDELNHQAKKMWVTGKWVAIDEQTLGFKGKSGMKLRISYKNEGDGFQCDAVCDRGYTYSFYFRHGDAPTLPAEFDEFELSPTARRVVWLAPRLPNDWTHIFMDNLFNSRKLFSALYRAKSLASGVTRRSGRGLPPSIIQLEEKNVKKAAALSGTTKSARLIDDPKCPDLLAVSVYDTKPVHMLSTSEESIEWITKRRKIWDSVHEDIKIIGFMRLGWIDNYNNKMNSTDISDQLRNVYRPDHWMRNRKWWWAFFIWAIGVAGVNAWKMYETMYDEEAKKKRGGMPPKWSHRDFMVELVFDMMYPEQTKAHVEMMTSMVKDTSFHSSVRSVRSFSSFSGTGREEEDEDAFDFTCESGIADYLKRVKQTTVNESRLRTNFFPRRLDGRRHGTVPCPGNVAHCQYCYYQWSNVFDDQQKEVSTWMKQNRKQIRRCLVCNVNLCYICEHEFHGISMQDNATLTGKK